MRDILLPVTSSRFTQSATTASLLPVRSTRQPRAGWWATCLLLLSCLLWLSPSVGKAAEVDEQVRQREQERIETIRRIAPSVVAIFAPEGKGGGSGVVVSPDGFVVTNFHVVQGLGNFMKCGLNDGELYDAVIVGIDPTGDVALIRLLGRDDFPTAEIGNSDEVRVGHWVYALGNPFLLANDFQPTVTYGMVSGVHRYQEPAGTFLEYTDCIQVDASINPGNSGGPLFSADGKLIGINGRISVESRGRVNVGAGYAISINQVMNFLDHLKSGRVVDHATLGATATSTSDGSVVISNILERSDAYRQGLRSGDELVSFAGRPVRSVNQYKNILGIYPKGWTLPLSFRREGERHDLRVQLMALHRTAELRPEQPKQPQGPLPLPIPGHEPKEPEAPDEFAHFYEDRVGFANYYFNRIRQEELLAMLASWGDFSDRKGLWTLGGQDAAGKSFEFKLSPDVAASRIGNDFAIQPLEEDFADQPPGTGGLLAALVQWKHLLVDPADYFTEFYYLGSEPFEGVGPRVDVLITTKGLVTTRWYFDRERSTMIGFDTSISEDMFPCEVRLGDQVAPDLPALPIQWTIRFGDRVIGPLTMTDFRFESQAE